MTGSQPNTLLLQRLDAVLGVPLAKYSSLARGTASFGAVLDPSTPARPVEARHEHPPEQPLRPARGPAATPADTAAGKAAASAAPGNAYPSSPTTLGPAARIVLELLQRYPQTPQPLLLRAPLMPSSAAPGAATATATATATVAGPAPADAATAPPSSPARHPAASSPDIALLAQMLARRVQASGMFYEAHLARVAFEGLPAHSLRDHPQAQWRALPSGDANGPPSHPSSPAPSPPGTPASAARPDAGLPAHAGATPAAAAAGAAAPSAGDIPAEQAQLVRQQLDVLSNQQWAARGEAWPGAAMAWEIARHGPPAPWSGGRHADADVDANAETHAGEQESATWQTRLTLRLPRLGEIDAVLRISPRGCSLQLQAAPQAEPDLQRHAARLQAQFDASGVRLLDLRIASAPPAAPPAPQPAS